MSELINKFLDSFETSSLKDAAMSDFIKNYDDKYRKKLCHIATTKSEDELFALYERAVNSGELAKDNAIAYCFASNPNLPTDIVNTICFETTADQSFYRPLFENNKEKMGPSTFSLVYDKESYMIRSPINYLKYKEPEKVKDEIPYSEEMMTWIAKEEFEKSFLPVRYSFGRNDVNELFRFIPSEECFDEIVDLIRKSPENKEAILTQMLNNPMIPEAKKDAVFDELGGDFRELKNPTPHMVEIIYASTVDTVFKRDMTRYSTKTREESQIYYDAVWILGDLARSGKLTSGMQFDLMNMLMERKDRSSETLTRELVNGTNDARVLHMALSLKSTNDKDDAIDNPYMAPDDLIAVAKISKKKLDAELKKGVYPSPKHRKRLLDLATRVTLPNDVYDTMFKVDDYATGNVLSSSPFTPRDIIVKTLNDALDPTARTRTPQEMQAKLMLFTIDNGLPTDKTLNLMEMLYVDSQKEEPKGFENYKRKSEYTAFITDNPYIEQYKEKIKEFETTLISEDYRKAATRVLKGLEDIKTWKPQEREEQEPHEMTDRRLEEKISGCGYAFNAGVHNSNKASLYLDLEKLAEEYSQLKAESDKRVAERAKDIEETR